MNGARRRLLQGIAAIAVVVAGAWFAVVEVRQRFTHVHETDARVAGDLVTVSARVAGRLVEFAVASGDRVERDQLIARIDARDAEPCPRSPRAERAAPKRPRTSSLWTTSGG